MKLTTDVARRLHNGVIAAVVHVASARPPSAAALAIEFDAAQRAITDRVRSSPTPRILESAFRDGVCLQTLKSVTRARLAGDGRLLGLRCPRLIESLDARQRRSYRTIVLDAAEAALFAQIEDDAAWPRISRWERQALQEVKEVFKADEWS